MNVCIPMATTYCTTVISMILINGFLLFSTSQWLTENTEKRTDAKMYKSHQPITGLYRVLDVNENTYMDNDMSIKRK